MPEEKGWAGAVPELYFDLIGRIPPGLFLSVVLLVLTASNYGWLKADIAGSGWSPSVIGFVLLVVASYSIGLLISPIGKRTNDHNWASAWEMAARKETFLLQKAQPYLNLNVRFDDEDSWGKLTRQERGLVFRHMHEVLKVNVPEAKLILPRLAAELTFMLNTRVAIGLASALLLFHWVFVNWPIWQRSIWKSPNVYMAASALILAYLASHYSAKERTQHLVERHFAFLGVFVNDKISEPSVIGQGGLGRLSPLSRERR